MISSLDIVDDTVEMGRVKEKIAVDFKLKYLGPLICVPGIEVQSKKRIVVLQQKYIIDLLKETVLLLILEVT